MNEDQINSLKSFTYNLVNWFCEVKGIKISEFNAKNDIDRIKFMKLLFFVAAVRGHESVLLDKFNNFCALPYGPVESDVYNYIKEENKIFDIKSYSLILKENNIDEAVKDSLNTSIADDFKELRKNNTNLINLPPFDLVEISHKWSSWRIAYSIAKSKGTSSYPMNKNSIISDVKFFN